MCRSYDGEPDTQVLRIPRKGCGASRDSRDIAARAILYCKPRWCLGAQMTGLGSELNGRTFVDLSRTHRFRRRALKCGPFWSAGVLPLCTKPLEHSWFV